MKLQVHGKPRPALINCTRAKFSPTRHPARGQLYVDNVDIYFQRRNDKKCWHSLLSASFPYHFAVSCYRDLVRNRQGDKTCHANNKDVKMLRILTSTDTLIVRRRKIKTRKLETNCLCMLRVSRTYRSETRFSKLKNVWFMDTLLKYNAVNHQPMKQLRKRRNANCQFLSLLVLSRYSVCEQICSYVSDRFVKRGFKIAIGIHGDKITEFLYQCLNPAFVTFINDTESFQLHIVVTKRISSCCLKQEKSVLIQS